MANHPLSQMPQEPETRQEIYDSLTRVMYAQTSRQLEMLRTGTLVSSLEAHANICSSGDYCPSSIARSSIALLLPIQMPASAAGGHWLSCVDKRMLVGRSAVGVSTNMHVEAINRVLKSVNLQRRVVNRLDK